MTQDSRRLVPPGTTAGRRPPSDGPDGSSALGRRAVRAPTAPLSTRDAERLRYVAAAGGWSIRLATSSGVLVAERADRSLYGRTERELADTIANSAAKGKK